MSVNAVPQISANWWMFLVMGLVSTIAGILAIVYPDLTLLAIGIFAGVSLLFIGAMEIVDAIAGDAESRPMSTIVGVLSVLAGLVCLRRPGESLPELSLVTLAVLFAISLLARGVFAILIAFRLRSVGHHQEPGAAAPA